MNFLDDKSIKTIKQALHITSKSTLNERGEHCPLISAIAIRNALIQSSPIRSFAVQFAPISCFQMDAARSAHFTCRGVFDLKAGPNHRLTAGAIERLDCDRQPRGQGGGAYSTDKKPDFPVSNRAGHNGL